MIWKLSEMANTRLARNLWLFCNCTVPMDNFCHCVVSHHFTVPNIWQGTYILQFPYQLIFPIAWDTSRCWRDISLRWRRQPISFSPLFLDCAFLLPFLQFLTHIPNISFWEWEFHSFCAGMVLDIPAIPRVCSRNQNSIPTRSCIIIPLPIKSPACTLLN